MSIYFKVFYFYFYNIYIIKFEKYLNKQGSTKIGSYSCLIFEFPMIMVII